MNRLLVEIEKLKKDVAKLQRSSRSSQDAVVKVDNVSGAQIDAGKVVYISDAGTARPEVELADNTSLAQASNTVGVVPYDIANNGTSYIVSRGYIRDIDTSSFAVGDTLYLGTSGNITNAQPSAPNAVLILGVCIVSDASAGVIYVNAKLLTDTSGASSPTNPEYVTMSADVGLANERVLTAGDAITLTDGGAGGNATLDVGVSGLGLTVDTTNVILASSNDVSAGGGASILASTTDGYLTLARLGIGVSPPYPFTIRNTNQPQMSLQYDASNYVNLYATSSGWFYAYSTGNQIFRRTTADTNSDFYFMANNSSFVQIRSNYDNSGTELSGLIFQDSSTSKWGIWKDTNDDLIVHSYDFGEAMAVFYGTLGIIDLRPKGAGGRVNINHTAEQIRIGYDASNYLSFTISSGGTALAAPTGNWEFNTGGDYINPTNNYEENLGMLSKKYLTLHAAELWVETLVAQNTIATIGGRILVGPTTKYAVDLADTDDATNEIDNPGFETAGGGGADVFANWIEGAGTGTITQSTTHRSGTYGCQLTAGSSLDTYVAQDVTVSPGEERCFSFWARNNGSDDLPRYQVWDNTNSANIISTTETDHTAGTVEWRNTIVNFTAPALCVSVRFLFRCPATNGDIAYFDDVVVHQGQQITVEHNQMSPGDIAYSEADGSVEFFWIIDGPNGSDPYTYQVLRNLDGTGANDWYAGDALFNTGAADDGFMDLYSYSGVTSGTVGPTIAGNVRNSTTYNDWDTHWAIGNMNGLYGYGADTYGAAFGEYVSGQPWVSVDSTNGFRINRYTTVLGQWDTSGDIYVGNQSTEHVKISSTAIQFIDGGTGYVYTDLTAGSLTLGYQSGGEYVVVSSAGVNLYAGGNSIMNFDAATGDARFGRTTGGNMYWDADAGTTGRLLFRGGTTTEAYIDTDGSIRAASGGVILDSDGVRIEVGAGIGDVNALGFFENGGSANRSYICGWEDSGSNNLQVSVASVTLKNSYYSVTANAPSGEIARSTMSAMSGSSGAGVYVDARSASDDYITLSCDYAMITDSISDGDLRVNGGVYIGSTSTAPGRNDLIVDGTISVGTTSKPSTNGSIYVNDYGVFLGGVHVGGTSDPGADHLLVDGNVDCDGLFYYDKANSFVVNLGSSGYTDITHNWNITTYTNSFWAINGDYPANGFTVTGIDYQSANVVRIYHSGGSSGGSARFNLMWVGGS